jgi:hypothetical protein
MYVPVRHLPIYADGVSSVSVCRDVAWTILRSRTFQAERGNPAQAVPIIAVTPEGAQTSCMSVILLPNNRNTMRFTSLVLLSALATISPVSAFVPLRTTTCGPSSTSLEYSVGIVGATGAVGKEIRQVLETRNKLPVDKLRIFGSERSAGSTVATKYGDVTVELFSEAAARER